MSRPATEWTPPEMSDTATTRAPLSCSSDATRYGGRRGDSPPRGAPHGRATPAADAEARPGAALTGEVPAEASARSLDHHHDACAGRLVAEERATDRHGLAGDVLRHGVRD